MISSNAIVHLKLIRLANTPEEDLIKMSPVSRRCIAKLRRLEVWELIEVCNQLDEDFTMEALEVAIHVVKINSRISTFLRLGASEELLRSIFVIRQDKHMDELMRNVFRLPGRPINFSEEDKEIIRNAYFKHQNLFEQQSSTEDVEGYYLKQEFFLELHKALKLKHGLDRIFVEINKLRIIGVVDVSKSH
jgi:hypothetical protein